MNNRAKQKKTIMNLARLGAQTSYTPTCATSSTQHRNKRNQQSHTTSIFEGGREGEQTIFIRDLYMEKKKLEASDVVSNNLLESPFKSTLRADRDMGIAFDVGLIHPNHHSSWLIPTHAFFFLLPLEICNPYVGRWLGFNYSKRKNGTKPDHNMRKM